MIGLVIASAALLALSVYLIGVYNGLVGLRGNIKVCWANLDFLFKRRHNAAASIMLKWS